MRKQRIVNLAQACVLLLLVLCLCAGCSFVSGPDGASEGENAKEEIVEMLTPRQIEILKKEGLPTDYDQLLISQKNDIRAIEAMLCYLENTYQVQAEYHSFIQYSPVNPEALNAFVDGVLVTVKRYYEDGQYIYSDNYKSVLQVPVYEQEITTFFTEKNLQAKVFADADIVENGSEDILAKTSAATFVYICADMDAEELKKLATAYSEWYQPRLNHMHNSTRISVVDEKLFEQITRENYDNLMKGIEEEKSILCIISVDGSITLR